MERLLTTRDLAEAIGASESSLRRWTNSGAIRTSRTVGGHRRIPLSEAVRFIRESRATVVRPQALGLPDAPRERSGDAASPRPAGASAVDESLYAALAVGDGARAKGEILSLYLGGAGLAAIFDGPVARAMHRVGELWRHDARGILVEHRATDLCLQAVNALRQLLAPAGRAAPAAIGGAPVGDPYLLPSIMAAAVLAEAGFRETNYGPQTPLDALAAAAEEQGVVIVWLSVSGADEVDQLRRAVEKLARRLARRDATLLVGGRLAGEVVAKPAPNVHVMSSMAQLAAFARGAGTAAADPGRAKPARAKSGP